MLSKRFALIVVCLLVCLPASGQNGAAQAASLSGSDLSSNNDLSGTVKGATLRGAWYSASDSSTPLPQGGGTLNNVFTDPYFGIAYSLPENWSEKYGGQPPSETGMYVLAALTPLQAYKNKMRGHMEIFAQDMFFTPFPANNALQLITYSESRLRQDLYKAEQKPAEIKIAGRAFVTYSYWSPDVGLHWFIAATEIRCHTVEFVLTGYDAKLLESLVQGLDRMKLSAEPAGGAVPVCIKDYTSSDNVITRVDPVFKMRRYNSIPVRIIIDTQGNVKHIHILSAFPEQQKAIYAALKQWKFRPYERNGQTVEVETGIVFGAPIR